MRQLRDDTHLILDGEVRVYQRERSQQTLPPLPLAQLPNHPPEYIDAHARARGISECYNNLRQRTDEASSGNVRRRPRPI